MPPFAVNRVKSPADHRALQNHPVSRKGDSLYFKFRKPGGHRNQEGLDQLSGKVIDIDHIVLLLEDTVIDRLVQTVHGAPLPEGTIDQGIIYCQSLIGQVRIN